jgi:uncharacterized membrane protein YdjX (TVP38/TMEM64 family)
VVVGICVFDFKLVQHEFDLMIQWIRVKPFEAVSVVMLVYFGSVVFTLPTTFTHIMLGFTYSQVFQSQLKGFCFALPVIFVGCTLGAIAAFLLSRYLFKDFVKAQVMGSGQWLSKNFEVIDELMQT